MDNNSRVRVRQQRSMPVFKVPQARHSLRWGCRVKRNFQHLANVTRPPTGQCQCQCQCRWQCQCHQDKNGIQKDKSHGSAHVERKSFVLFLCVSQCSSNSIQVSTHSHSGDSLTRVANHSHSSPAQLSSSQIAVKTNFADWTADLDHAIAIYYTILSYTILLCTMLLQYTILYSPIVYYSVLYYTTLHYTILFCTIPRYYTKLHYTILFCTIQYYTTLYSPILY